ncbi:MAG: carbohydrate kinase [Clostridia bacterium]|nr:carbohydrate kinase [Clostridia bacterium]
MPTLCADVFEQTGEVLPGGEALNFAAHASKYPGIDVGLVGAIGDDEVGRHVLSAIEARPIDRAGVHVIPGGETASHFISTDENGDRYFKPGAWHGGVYDAFRPDAADEALLQAADMVFITYSAPCFPQVLALRKRSTFRLAVDFDVCRDLPGMEAALPWVDFFLISGDDAFLPVARAWSERFSGLFNVTLAERGSVTYADGQEYRVPAVPVEKVVDTTGCGDSYHAGFLCAYLQSGDIPSAMDEGSRVASGTLAHTGGF